jgi:hypothetical protein
MVLGGKYMNQNQRNHNVVGIYAYRIRVLHLHITVYSGVEEIDRLSR